MAQGAPQVPPQPSGPQLFPVQLGVHIGVIEASPVGPPSTPRPEPPSEPLFEPLFEPASSPEDVAQVAQCVKMPRWPPCCCCDVSVSHAANTRQAIATRVRRTRLTTQSTRKASRAR